MAVLTSTGITFGDSTSLNSKYGIIPQSSREVFFQASAPTGWTQIVAHNDKAMRIVSGTGGGTGGATAFSTIYSDRSLPASTASPHTLSNPQGVAHNHTHQDIFAKPGASPALGTSPTFGTNKLLTTTVVSTPAGGGTAHTHPIIAGPVNLSVQYIDVIICSFD